MAYAFIAGTILFTVYGQLVIKWQVSHAGLIPAGSATKLLFLVRLALNPWVISSYVAAFVASLFWIAAMRHFDLSYAYPFTSLSFVLVSAFSVFFFRESITGYKLLGLIIIIAGIIVASRR